MALRGDWRKVAMD